MNKLSLEKSQKAMEGCVIHTQPAGEIPPSKNIESRFYSTLDRDEEAFLKKLIKMLKPQAVTFQVYKLPPFKDPRVPDPKIFCDTAFIETKKGTVMIVKFVDKIFSISFETAPELNAPLFIFLDGSREDTLKSFATYCGIKLKEPSRSKPKEPSRSKPEETSWERFKRQLVNEWLEVVCAVVAFFMMLSALVIIAISVAINKNQLPAQVKTEAHRQWVLEQCSRPNLDEQTKQSCKNFFEE